LTVIDFIGAQRREFRFAQRFRAVSTNPAGRVDSEIEQGFPHLPNGCTLHLERIAQQRVLDNVRESVRLMRPRMIGNLREFGRFLGRAPSIPEALDYLDTSLEELLKRGLWSQTLADAGLAEEICAPDAEKLAKGLGRLCHIDDAIQIRHLLQYLESTSAEVATDEFDKRLIQMLHITLWGEVSLGWSVQTADERLRQNPSVICDVVAVLQHRLLHAPVQQARRLPTLSGPLTIHSQYTRDEILIGLGRWSLDRRPGQREGVLHIPQSKVDAFFVTLQKTEEDYSPTTMYEDYLISHELFHWQSQSNTSAQSPTGERYIHHRQAGYTPLLFVRESRSLTSGRTSPYVYLGPCEYVSHEGSRPMSIIWRLQHAVPARLFRRMARQSTG
jgi:hypothetical protein